MTSAFAHKMIRQLTEEKQYWLLKEENGCSYCASADEEPVIPDYHYDEVAERLAEIDNKILKIRHAVNVSNCSNTIEVMGETLTIDMALIRMAQLSKLKDKLDRMRRQEPKTRTMQRISARMGVPEYLYINYDLGLVKKDFQETDERITKLQLALDRYNQTVEFDVDI